MNPHRGFTGIEGRKSDVEGAGDPKLEEEKEKENFLSAIVKSSKKREKIIALGPRLTVTYYSELLQARKSQTIERSNARHG